MEQTERREWSEKVAICTAVYKQLFKSYAVEIPETGLLAGMHQPMSKFKKAQRMEIWQIFHADNMHYPLSDDILHYGIGQVLELMKDRQPEDTDETAAYRKGVYEVYKEVGKFIAKHAKKALSLSEQAADEAEKCRLLRIASICKNVSRKAPQSFLEAFQFFWFLYLLRSPFGGGSIGRLDKKLYPFYLKDKERGTWNREDALLAIMQFYGKLNDMGTGDTLRNLMLSGQNEDGEDETSELTYLFLEAYEKTGDAEPHLNVRLHEKSPKELVDYCVRLLAAGHGQPTIYFDENFLPAMERAGIPHRDACCYANDGCTETVYDGRSNIVFYQHEMVKTVELTMFNGEENPSIYPVTMQKSRKVAPSFVAKTELQRGFQSGALSDMHSFSDFLDAFFRQLSFQLSYWIKVINEKIEADETDTLTSPLVGGTFEKCLMTGRDPLRGGGFDVANYQLLSGTVSTAADCLRAVEYAVFEKGFCTLEELRDALAADFEGYELLRKRLLLAPKYGNGEKRVNELAAMISRKFLDEVGAYRSRSGKRIHPGLYNIDFKIFANVTGATPDGRKFRDAIGEHCSPTPGAAKKGPTAIVESASFLPMREGYASSVLHLTLDGGSFVMGADREKIVRQLLTATKKAGVPVCSLTMYKKDELLDAKVHPKAHQDLIVRVWGFNARFVELDEEMQEHIINRIA